MSAKVRGIHQMSQHHSVLQFWQNYVMQTVMVASNFKKKVHFDMVRLWGDAAEEVL